MLWPLKVLPAVMAAWKSSVLLMVEGLKNSGCRGDGKGMLEPRIYTDKHGYPE
jgi:hypothetical protein